MSDAYTDKYEDPFRDIDVEYWNNLANCFPFLLQELGMDRQHPMLFRLFSDDMRVTATTDSDRAIVEAWMAWQLEFHGEKTLFWLTQKNAWAPNIITGVIAATAPLGVYCLSKIERRTTHEVFYDSNSRLFVRSGNENSCRGMSLNHVVVEGIDPESKRYEDILINTYPRLWNNTKSSRAKFVTIWQPNPDRGRDA